MPLDVTPHLDPAKTAIVNMECQENLLGDRPLLPGLAESARRTGLLDNLSALFDAGRKAGVRIYYCTDERRPDGFGFAHNTFVNLRASSAGGTTGGQGPVMPQIAPRPEDVVFRREQGLTGFFATGLDQYLRNTKVSTLIVTGVSLNIAVLGTAIEAMNLGYTVVIPPDCIASDPYEYAETVVRYTMRNIAFVVPSTTITAAWR
ncbi:cysteine hydrolase [Frankia sp. QA3]|uniref:cysteine hydrolase n=1 Tax=Frankia sp. QA3 TaxID=710111 RepID=UPI000269C148|nr:cysteine hydrolase [Frankia sp. QA3]EIV91624.1 nicotinamidase-like amidase [Frankia sp. QA3]